METRTSTKVTTKAKVKKARDAKEYDTMLFDFIEQEILKGEIEQHEER